MSLDEQQREKLTAAVALLRQAGRQRNALVVRPANQPAVVRQAPPPAVVPRQELRPAEAAPTRSVAELSAAALAEAAQLTQLQARLAALCADHRTRGTCPGRCVRGRFR
jgi:hypothetical protein